MKLLGSEILNSTIVHTEFEEESLTVDDILLNPEANKISYLTLKLSKPSHEIDSAKSKGFLEMLNPFSDPGGMEKQRYYIPDSKIDDMEPGTVWMRGKKVEGERVPPIMDCRKYIQTLDTKIETVSGSDLGTVKDIVADSSTKTLIAFQIEKGNEGKIKYIPYKGNVEWSSDKLTLADDSAEKLVDEIKMLA